MSNCGFIESILTCSNQSNPGHEAPFSPSDFLNNEAGGAQAANLFNHREAAEHKGRVVHTDETRAVFRNSIYHFKSGPIFSSLFSLKCSYHHGRRSQNATSLIVWEVSNKTLEITHHAYPGLFPCILVAILRFFHLLLNAQIVSVLSCPMPQVS